MDLNNKVTRNDDGTVTVKLDYPLKTDNGKKDCAEITLQRPKAKHLAAGDSIKGDISRTLTLIESLSGVNKRDLLELDGEDLNRVSDEVVRLVGKSPD